MVTGRFPVTPVESGSPVQLVRVPLVGVPSAGVTRVGLVAKTRDPLPVSSVTAAAKFALEGVVRNVATPEAGVTVARAPSPIEVRAVAAV